MIITQKPDIDLRKCKKILLLGVDRLGDMLFATPAIKMLKDELPQAQFDIAVFSDLVRQAMFFNPAITHIHLIRFRWQAAWFIKRLAKRYDVVLPMHDNRTNRAGSAGIANAFIYERDYAAMPMRQHPAEFVRAILNKPDLPIPQHYQLFPQAEHFDYVKALLVEKGVDFERDCLIGCHPGCRRVSIRGGRMFKGQNTAGDTKSWEFSNYAQLLERFSHSHPHYKFVLTGTKSEARIAQEYLSHLPNVVNMIGKTDVLQLAALIQQCQLFLTADTGPSHVACSTDIPMVALFGKSDPARYGPYPLGQQRIVLRKSNNVDDITVDEVEAAIKKLLKY